MASLVLSESSHTGSKLDARLKVRLARLQWEKEEREGEFQLRRELEIRNSASVCNSAVGVGVPVSEAVGVNLAQSGVDVCSLSDVCSPCA
ncbi:hypothetical protein F7725_025821, partial [Dissostichus mawsoni]